MKHHASTHTTVFRPRHSSTTRRHAVWNTVVMSTAAVASFSLAYAFTTLNQIEDSITVRDISSLVAPAPPGSTNPNDPLAGRAVNILIMGSDVRDGENATLGGGRDIEGMRADATIIMHISADRQRIELISIPRDLRVAIPDCTFFDGTVAKGWTTKFNVAFANGGRYGDVAEAAACTVNTVTSMTGVHLDHYVVMDFAGFRDMVDAIDGIPMCIPRDVYSSKANLDLKAGPQVLDGTTALAWARARTGKGLGDGSDPTRISRQQELLGSLMRKTIAMNLLTDAPQLTSLMKSVGKSLTMDPALADLGYLGGLAFSLRNLDTDNIYFVTVPWGSAGDGSGDIVMKAEAATLFAKLLADEPLDPDYLARTQPGMSPTPSAAPRPSPDPTNPGATEPTPSKPADQVAELEAEIFDACA